MCQNVVNICKYIVSHITTSVDWTTCCIFLFFSMQYFGKLGVNRLTKPLKAFIWKENVGSRNTPYEYKNLFIHIYIYIYICYVLYICIKYTCIHIIYTYMLYTCIYKRTFLTDFYMQWRSSEYITYMMYPGARIVTKPFWWWWCQGGNIIFMITYLLCP